MERMLQSRTSKLNLCLGAEIVHFGSMIYGCYLDVLLDILDVWDILNVLLGCLCGDVIVNIWMFINGCYVWMCKCAKRAKCAKCAKCLVVVCLLEMNILQLSHTHTHTYIYIYIYK